MEVTPANYYVTFGTDRDDRTEGLALHLDCDEVSAGRTREKVVFVIFRKVHGEIFPHHHTQIDHLGLEIP